MFTKTRKSVQFVSICGMIIGGLAVFSSAHSEEGVKEKGCWCGFKMHSGNPNSIDPGWYKCHHPSAVLDKCSEACEIACKDSNSPDKPGSPKCHAFTAHGSVVDCLTRENAITPCESKMEKTPGK